MKEKMMIPGTTATLTIEICDILVDTIDSAVFTINKSDHEEIPTLQKIYPGVGINVTDEVFYIFLSQEETLLFEPDRLYIEGQINFKNKTIGKTGVVTYRVGRTLATTMIEGNAAVEAYTDAIKLTVESRNYIVGTMQEIEDNTALSQAAAAEAETAKTIAISAKDTALEQVHNAAEHAEAAADSAIEAAGSAENAATSKEAIQNMTVTAQPRLEGSAPTVTKTINEGIVNLEFGIPKGNTGAQGPPSQDGIQGLQGEAGPNEVTTLTATDLSGLLKGNGSTVEAAIAGTDYEPALPATAGNNGKVLGISGDVLTWVEQITGIPSMSGNAGKILTNDGTNASWSNKLTSNNINSPTLWLCGLYNQSAEIFKVSKWSSEGQTGSYSYLTINNAGTIGTSGLNIVGQNIQNKNSNSNATITLNNNGVLITRNISDSAPALQINNINSASTGNIVDFQFSGGLKAHIDKNGNYYSNGFNLQIETSMPPASATSDGLKGSIRWDEDYIYVCTDTNIWKRTSLTTW